MFLELICLQEVVLSTDLSENIVKSANAKQGKEKKKLKGKYEI